MVYNVYLLQLSSNGKIVLYIKNLHRFNNFQYVMPMQYKQIKRSA